MTSYNLGGGINFSSPGYFWRAFYRSNRKTNSTDILSVCLPSISVSSLGKMSVQIFAHTSITFCDYYGHRSSNYTICKHFPHFLRWSLDILDDVLRNNVVSSNRIQLIFYFSLSLLILMYYIPFLNAISLKCTLIV